MVLELIPRTINSIIAKSFQDTTLEATHPLTDPLICWVVTRSHWSKVFTSKSPGGPIRAEDDEKIVRSWIEDLGATTYVSSCSRVQITD